MVCDLSNQPDQSADWSSQIDTSRLESADELKEIDTTEKKEGKEFENNNTENFDSENDELNKEASMEKIETDDDNKEEAVTEEEELEKDDQHEDYSVTGNQIFHPGEDNIEERNCQRRETAKERKINWWREIGSLKLQRPKVLVLLQYFIILSLLIFN